MGTPLLEEDRERAALRDRARRTAQTVQEELERIQLGSFALVTMGARVVGLATTGLTAIVPMPPIAVLPDLPPWLPGLVQIRGEPLGVVDLRRLHDLPSTTTATLIGVIQGAPGRVGLLLERVEAFRIVFRDELSGSRAQGSALPLLGTTRDLVDLLDIDAVLNDPRIAVLSGSTDPQQGRAAAASSSRAAESPKRGQR